MLQTSEGVKNVLVQELTEGKRSRKQSAGIQDTYSCVSSFRTLKGTLIVVERFAEPNTELGAVLSWSYQRFRLKLAHHS